jgi:hypothetical protein
MCLDHYLDEAFTGATRALQICQEGQSLDSRTVHWLAAQGDMAVRLLSNASAESSDQRSRLLELLLCLAHVQECCKRRDGVNK